MKFFLKSVSIVFIAMVLLFTFVACSDGEERTVEGLYTLEVGKDLNSPKKMFKVYLIITVSDTKVVKVKIDKDKDYMVASDNYYAFKFEAGMNDLLRQYSNKPFSFFKDFYQPTQFAGGLSNGDIYKKKLTITTGASFTASLVTYAVKTMLMENKLI